MADTVAPSKRSVAATRAGLIPGVGLIVLILWLSTIDFTVTRGTVFTGLMTGAMTGLLAVGIVLVYRSTKVINFAYGEVGIFGATLLSILVLNYGWNYWLSLVVALVAGAAFSIAIEMTVVRRLFEAPRVILFAATLGVSQLVLVATLELPDTQAGTYPSPFFVLPSRSNPDATYSLLGFDIPFEIFGVQVLGRDVMVLLFVPLVVVLLTLFMGRTLYGLCVRASASNADAARLAGVSPRKMSTVVWAIAGALAVLTAVILIPVLGIPPGPQARILGPTILLRALAGALAGRMESMPKAMAAGMILGVVEELIRFNTNADRLLLNDPGFAFMVLFLVVLGLVLWHSRVGFGDRDKAFSFSPRTRPAPMALRDRVWVQRLPQIVGMVALVVAILLPFVYSRPSKLIILSTALLWAVIALSVTVMTGWGGQLSLGQYALVGVGGMTTASLTTRGIPWGGGRWFADGLPFGVALVLATVVTIVVAMIIGAPALRVRGLFLAVTTFAFAVACEFWLLGQPIFIERGATSVFVPRASLGPIDLSSERTYYYVCLAVLVLAATTVARLRRGGIGRTLIAVRDNEPSAQAFTVSPTRAKFIAFALGGALTGVAGGLLIGLQQSAAPAEFTVTQSLNVIAVAIVGGVGTVAGPIIGAMWTQGLPAVVSFTDEVNLLRSGIGLLIMLMYFPGGLVQIGYAIRDGIFDVLAKRAGPVDTSRNAAAPIPARPKAERSDEVIAADTPALQTDEVTVRFGGKVAVDRVSITAAQGEVVGLIGGNGAGKSTLMNAIGGFVPSDGTVHILGTDVSSLSPHRRARMGLGRTFQAADLFGDLTVLETVQVALEARDRADLAPALLGLPSERRSESRKKSDASDLVSFLGLGRYANSFINELSTGTRRICELACLLAVDARVLCLDEPTAGVAQRETEAFGPLIKRIQAELGATLIVIEHDMPLIMSISDRVYCLEAGQLIAEGDPSSVRNDPLVIASYLGTDARAIERSGTTTPIS